jgi:NADH:ubiquinone oxidoreductase subunit E
MLSLEHDTQIEEILEKYYNRNQQDLIPILQEIQELKGYISQDAVNQVSRIH